MSSFYCEICGAIISDTERGYVTGCKHYPLSKRKKLTNKQIEKLICMLKKS